MGTQTPRLAPRPKRTKAPVLSDDESEAEAEAEPLPERRKRKFYARRNLNWEPQEDSFLVTCALIRAALNIDNTSYSAWASLVSQAIIGLVPTKGPDDRNADTCRRRLGLLKRQPHVCEACVLLHCDPRVTFPRASPKSTLLEERA
jgi:hypothetical protein